MSTKQKMKKKKKKRRGNKTKNKKKKRSWYRRIPTCTMQAIYIRKKMESKISVPLTRENIPWIREATQSLGHSLIASLPSKLSGWIAIPNIPRRLGPFAKYRAPTSLASRVEETKVPKTKKSQVQKKNLRMYGTCVVCFDFCCYF